MKRLLKRAAGSLAAACVGTALMGAAPASAQTAAYPAHPINLMVPFTAGGGLDFTARLLGQHLEAALGKPVVVENKPGAGGVLGVRSFVGKAPDGYSLLMSTAGEITIAPSLNSAASYDPVKDLAPVAIIVRAPNVLAVSVDLPIKNLAELVAYAKKHPGKLTYSTSGIGTAHHLIGESLNRIAGIETGHIPFKGASQQVLEVAAGRVSFTYASPAAVGNLVKDGRLRAIAVANAERIPSMPDVPTIQETLDKFRMGSWFGMFAPAGTPPAIISRLNGEIQKILKNPEVAEKLGASVGSPSFGSPADFGKIVAQDLVTYKRIIQEAGIAVQ